MTDPLAPFDVAQHWPFLDRQLVRTPPAVRRALRLLAEGQVESEGEACSIRQRVLAEPYASPGEAGRASVILRELEKRGVVVGYRGRGSRGHLWSFRPSLRAWDGFDWVSGAKASEDAIGDCFCRAVDNFVARFPGQSLVQIRKRAHFELLPRDHISPPGLFLVETRANDRDRATNFRRPGLQSVETRDKSDVATPDVLSIEEELEVLLSRQAEEEKFRTLKKMLEHHTKPNTVWAGTAPEATLRYLAQALAPEEVKAVCRRFDHAFDRVTVKGGAAEMRTIAQRYLPQEAAAL